MKKKALSLEIQTSRLRIRSVCFALAVLAAWTNICQADIILDLTTEGSSGTINGAIFSTTDKNPTGTGVIKPFVRIQSNGNEEGYNTDAKKGAYDEKKGLWTHSLLVGAPRTITIDNVDYLEFLLDINQKASKPLLSLDRLLIFQETAGDFTDPIDALWAGAAVQVYDLDVGGDNWIKLNYDLNPGSGWGDIYAYIPKSNFDLNNAAKNLYLYSRFGDQPGYESNAGFEEWATDPPGAPVPVPGAALLGFIGLATSSRILRGRQRKTLAT